jgi:MGT family glycosyltransferase
MNVLMATWDCGGNVPPFVGLGSELVQRGHQVECLGSESLRAVFNNVGVHLVSVRGQAAFDPLARLSGAASADAMFGVFFGPDYIASIRQACLERRPDVLVIDYCLAGPLAVAETLRIPTVVLVHTLPGRILPNWDRNFLGLANDARRSVGAQAVRSTAELWSRSQAVIVTTIGSLDGFCEQSRDVALNYIGPVFEPVDASSGDLGAYIAEDKPTVLVSFSTTFMDQEAALTQTILALGGLQVHGLVTTGPSVDPWTLPTAGNVIKERYLPHAHLLPHVSAAVVHAGHGSVTKALAFGVPLLCMPLGRDQMYISDRIVALGAGLRLENTASAPEIAAALQRLISDRVFRDEALRLSQELRGLGPGERNGANVVEAVAARVPA